MNPLKVIALAIAFGIILFILFRPINQGPLDHVSNTEIKDIIQRGWDNIGGWDKYKSIRTITYKKRSVLYHEDGSIESDVSQVHSFKLRPDLSGILKRVDTTGVHATLFGPEAAYKSFDGSRIEGSELAAERSFLSAHFVLFAPFKLADPATLFYDGVEKLESGKEADVIRAHFRKPSFPNNRTDDTWYMYFEKNTGNFLGNLIYHAPTYAFIENIETTIVDGMKWNTYRKTWRVDADLNREYLRGEFWYSDYELTFDKNE